MHESRMGFRRPGRGRLLAIAAFVAVAANLSFVASASASWGWTGYVPQSAADCPAYPTLAKCSPWYVWYQVNAYDYGPAIVLAGFEKDTGIRGTYLGTGGRATVLARAVYNYGDTLKGVVSWCLFSWPGNPCPNNPNTAYVWFRVYETPQ